MKTITKVLGGLVGIFFILMIIGALTAPESTPINNTTSTVQTNNTTEPIKNNTTQSTSTPVTPTYKTVTINKLYHGDIAQGTYIKVSGTVMQQVEEGIYLIRDSDYNVIAVETSQTAYSGTTLTVKGIYIGPISYTTVVGASNTVPAVMEE